MTAPEGILCESEARRDTLLGRLTWAFLCNFWLVGVAMAGDRLGGLAMKADTTQIAQKGYSVQQIRGGVYWLTDGAYKVLARMPEVDECTDAACSGTALKWK